MSEVRVKIQSATIAETIVSPIWSAVFSRKIERDRIYYTHEPDGSVTLRGPDYQLLYDLDSDCEQVTFSVDRKCDGDWVPYWQGVFSKFDCKFDSYRCTASIKLRKNDLYDCLAKEWSDVINIYTGTGSEIVTREFKGAYEVAIGGPCYICRATPDDSPVCTRTDSCIEYTHIEGGNGNCPTGQFYVETSHHRITATGTPTVPPPYGTGWTLLSDSTWWRCPVESEELVIGVLRFGRRFDDVLEYMVGQAACGLTVRSHFFGINNTHAAPPSNDAYAYATAHYLNMTVHQKSDVKRPDSSNAALSKSWTMKLKDLLADLQTMFNVFWRIDGTDIIIEHISYFTTSAGADYTDRIMPLQFEYDADIPRREVFTWSDEAASNDFRGKPIVYDCGNDDRERRVTLFSTDVVSIRNLGDQDFYADSNFVLLCNIVTDGEYWIDDHNKPLGWVKLHDKLHRHYRPFGSGNMNGEATTFLSTQSIRKQPAFTVPFCCGDEYDPENYITTPLGQGRIEEAKENLYKDTLELKLNY